MIGYDKLSIYHDIVLDLPFREGTGTITHDIAKPHHPLTLNDPGGGLFTWGNLASGCPYLQFAAVGGGPADGVYLDCPAADTGDLDFTTGDYSLSVWLNWDSTGGWSEIIMGRYGVDLDGWEIYLDISGGLNTVSQRHHHVSLAPNTNSNCFSTGWTPGNSYLLGISRIGGDLYPVHYRNGLPLEMTYEDSGMLAPDACNRDLVIGCRYTKDANWYRNMMWRPRIWARALAAWEWLQLFNMEKHWFGL